MHCIALRKGNALLPRRSTNWSLPEQEGAFQAAEALKLQQQCSAADAFGCYPGGTCTTLQAAGAQHHIFSSIADLRCVYWVRSCAVPLRAPAQFYITDHGMRCFMLACLSCVQVAHAVCSA